MKSYGELAADWPQLNRLLDEALALPPSERVHWLLSLPGEHLALKDTLARLLEVRSAIETGDFLGTLPKVDAASAPHAETPASGVPRPGQEVGPRRLIDELGEGGMGSVWLAERADGSLKRQVALKLPRLTWVRGLAERMSRERDILATLEHPHIARLYDAGVDPFGRPWLALERVQGRPIDQYARDRSLTVPQRVALLLQVCEAVSYAHSRLVIHRDLKPGNVLVTDDGTVKLLDFGIAKLMSGDRTEGTALTALAGMALTPDYASPEQVRGQSLTTASDVYSLGIVAYELLAGARPYRLKRGTAAELEEAIQNAELPAASATAAEPALRRALRGDLDAVLAQALSKDPNQRYAGVAQLAEDLGRYLRGEAVGARQVPLSERVARAVRRQPVPVALGVGVALALLGGLYAQAAVTLAMAIGTAVALWQRREALQQREAAAREGQRAAAAAEEARREADRAEKAAAAEREAALAAQEQARRAERIKKLLLGAFSAADTDGIGQQTTRALDVLRAADVALGAEPWDDPVLALELKGAVAYALAGHGEHAEALAVVGAALERAPDLPAAHPQRLAVLCLRGDCLQVLGRADEAVEMLQAVADAAQAAGDVNHQSRALRLLGSCRLDTGDRAGAARADQGLQALLEASGHLLDPRERVFALQSHANLLGVLNQPGELAAAQSALEAARAHFGSTRSITVLTCEIRLALAESSAGRPADAAARLRHLIDEARQRYGDRHAHLGVWYNYLANAQLACGNGAGARQAMLEDAARAQAAGEDPQGFNAAMGELLLSGAAAQMRWHEEAVQHAQRAEALLVALHGDAHPFAGLARLRRAMALAHLDQIEEADALITVEANAKVVDPVSLLVARCLVALDAGRSAEALVDSEALMASLAAGTSQPVKARAWLVRGRCLLAAGDAAAALEPLTQAQEALGHLHRDGSNDRAELDACLGEAHLATGNLPAARACFERALAHWQRQGDVPRARALAQLGRAQCEQRSGNHPEAHRLRLEAQRVLAQSPLARERQRLLAALEDGLP